MAISIRALSETNLKIADSIVQSAFQRTESSLKELRLIYKLQPEGAFMAYHWETPVGVVASLIYPHFAYVGPLGVHREFQRQGIGLALMQRLLFWLDQKGVSQVLLDASPMGQPLYDKLDFVARGQIHVLQRQDGLPRSQPPPEVQFLTPQNLDLITAADKQAFGTDRSKLLGALLEAYPQRGFILRNEQGGANGYLIAQERTIGPWVSRTKADAELLLRAALALTFNEPVSVIVPGENPDAIIMLQAFGFETVRVLRHMVRGSNTLSRQRETIYGQASLSLG
jgi:GNAT superfamily N-acetyltransferase